jgi:hypothetical protein
MDERLPTLDLIAKLARLLMKRIIFDELEGLVSVDREVRVWTRLILSPSVRLKSRILSRPAAENGRMRAIREDELIRGRTTPKDITASAAVDLVVPMPPSSRLLPKFPLIELSSLFPVPLTFPSPVRLAFRHFPADGKLLTNRLYRCGHCHFRRPNL